MSDEDTPDPLELELRATVDFDRLTWRVFSHRLGIELWIARNAETARALDQAGIRAGLPVLFADDLDSFPATATTASLRARFETLAARNAARDWRGGGPVT